EGYAEFAERLEQTTDDELEFAASLLSAAGESLPHREGRRHADNEFELLAAGVVPAKTAFRLESHRINRLRLEFPVQHQKCRIGGREYRADLFAIGRGFGIGLPGGKSFPDRASRAVEESWADPAILDRRVDIGCVGSRASNARETKLAVVGHFDRAGCVAELEDRCVAQPEPRLIEGAEILEDQQRDRLTQIKRRLADRAKEVAGIEFGNAD